MSAYSYADSRLSIVDQELTAIPPSLASQYSEATVLDLTANQIRLVHIFHSFKQHFVQEKNFF